MSAWQDLAIEFCLSVKRILTQLMGSATHHVALLGHHLDEKRHLLEDAPVMKVLMKWKQ